jgi:hypothetical protein
MKKIAARFSYFRSAGAVKEDYEHFVPEFERLVRQHGKLRVLFDMTGFHGWEASALWEDIKFDSKHFADIERLAMVGKTSGSTVWRRSDTSTTLTLVRRGGG